MQREILMYFQQISSPALDAAMEGITMLGEQYVYIAVISLVYWNISKRAGFLLASAYLFSALVNAGIKLTVRAPRPFETLEGIEAKRVHTATGYSFPSGHTQGAAGFFTVGALIVRRRWAWAAAITAMVLVAISRVYLGVHWPVDVVFGLIFGVFCAWLVFALAGMLMENRSRFLSVIRVIAITALVVTVVMLVLDGIGTFAGLKVSVFFKGAGTFVGALGGFYIEERFIRFDTVGDDHGESFGSDEPLGDRRRKLLIKTVRYAAGVLTTVGLLVGLKGLFPEGNLFTSLRYFLLGAWITALYPAVGIRLGLFGTETSQ
ncbi:MAG: phosphatase PAP2 family protein [Spirochaetaceae bacterium]